MRAVNLLRDLEVPSSGRSESRLRFPRVSGPVGIAAFAVIACAAIAVLSIGAGSTVAERERELDRLKVEEAAIKAPPPAPVDDGSQRENAVLAALSSRIPWDSLLRQVAQVTPDDVWVTGLTAQAPTAAAADATAAPAGTTGSPTQFTLTGYTYSQRSVARVLAQLALVPHLANVQLQSAVRTQVGKRSLVQFAIAADVRPQGEA